MGQARGGGGGAGSNQRAGGPGGGAAGAAGGAAGGAAAAGLAPLTLFPRTCGVIPESARRSSVHRRGQNPVHDRV